MRIAFDPILPQEGTLEITIDGLMPNVPNDWAFMSLFSRDGARFRKVYNSPGSYVLFKTDEDIYPTHDFKFFTSSIYGSAPGSDRTSTEVKLDDQTNKERTIKIVWNHSKIYLVVDNKQMVSHQFRNQFENFAYLNLASDNEYTTNWGTMTYKNLKILGPATNYPFTNIATRKRAMADSLIGNQGVTIADINGDGTEELQTARFYSSNHNAANLLFIGQENGDFIEEGAIRGVGDTGHTFQTITADFDNDGDNDAFYANYSGQKAFLLNDGSGNFTNVSNARIFGNSTQDTKASTIIDLENDGDSDVIVLNALTEPEVFVNNGSATFTKEDRGLSGYSTSELARYQSIAVADVNNDRYQDIILIRQMGTAHLLLNNKSGSFYDAGGLVYSGPGSSASFGDIDNDGDLDMAIFEASNDDSKTRIFRNDSFGNFNETQNISANAFGGVLADWNNDAYLDLYISARKDGPGILYVNDGTGNFVLADGSGVENKLKDARGAAILDVDNDGDMDIYAASRGAEFNGRSYSRNFLYRNDIANANNWIKVAIYNESNSVAGLGSKIKVYEAGYLSGNTSKSLIGYREIMGTTGFLSQSSWIQHIGLATNSIIDVQVEFPNGDIQQFKDQPVNRTIEIRPSLGIPTTFVIENGNQAGKAGAPLENDINVYVSNEFNEPASGVSVNYEILGGNGTVNGSSTTILTTDAAGYASTSWIMGPTASVQNDLKISVLHDGQHITNSPQIISITPTVNDPSVINIISGNNQQNYIGKDLASPLVIEISDAFGNKIPDHQATFQVISGSGLLNNSPDSVHATTDAAGRAQVIWQLGLLPGQQQVRVAALFNGANLTNSPINFFATANEPDLKLTKTAGDSQITQVNQRLPQPFQVRVTNNFEQPVQDVVVKFAVISGGGGFEGNDSLLTNADGYATLYGKTGTVAGTLNNTYTADVQNASGSPVSYKASATAGAAAKIDSISGSGQTGRVAQVVLNPFIARILDSFNNPVIEHAVVYNVIKGGGQILGKSTGSLLSDEQGYVRATLTLGQMVDTNIVQFSSDGLEGSPVVFQAYSQPGDPGILSYVDGSPQQGIKGNPLTWPFKTKITDVYGNPIFGHNVLYKIIEGDGNFSAETERTVPTDTDGIASALLTCGPAAFRNSAWATSEYNGSLLPDSPILFEATTGPGDPDSVVIISGNNQTARIRAQMPAPFIAMVKDINGVGVPNIQVEFAALTSGASFGGELQITKTTDANGLAEATATIGDIIGTYQFQIAARFNNIPIQGSRTRMYAFGRKSTAVKMERMADSSQVNYAGTIANNAVSILVTDKNGLPVVDHPVLFSRKSGRIWIINNNSFSNSLSVNSNNEGIASIDVNYFEQPENSIIEATSNDGVDELGNSGILFYLEGIVGSPSVTTSSISVPNSVPALGDTAFVDIVLKDKFDNPISGKTVIIHHQSENVQQLFITNADTTDLEGKTQGFIQSFDVGKVVIWGTVDETTLAADTINFVPGPPKNVVIHNNFNNVKLNEIVEIAIDVQDERRHPIPGNLVTFVAQKGTILTPQPVATNQEGKAITEWQVANTLGEQKVDIIVNGFEGTKSYSAFVVVNALNVKFEKVSGDSILGLINSNLPEKFMVVLQDSNGTALSGETVVFESDNGGSFPSINNTTDSNGQAWAQFMAGPQTGEYNITAKIESLGKAQIFVCYIEAEPTLTLLKKTTDQSEHRPFSNVLVQAQALDPFERPVKDAALLLNVKNGGGSIEASELVTDADGLIGTFWTLGNVGIQELLIEAKEKIGSVQFSYTVKNSPPEINNFTADETETVKVGELISIGINAIDSDADDLFYQVTPMPDGATFSELVGDLWSFSWEPTEAQAGNHPLTFYVTDVYGAKDSASTIIKVISGNSPPEIQSYIPANDTIFHAPNEQKFAQVSANDPDFDSISYRWYSPQKTFETTTNTFFGIFSVENFGPSPSWLIVVVSDGKDSTEHRWEVVEDLTSVELSLFEATEVNMEIKLVWTTADETNNLGFHIQRSESKNGTFEHIHSGIIESMSNGNYFFFDGDVQSGKTYFYKLIDVDKSGRSTEHGPVSITVSVPTQLALGQNYPNPFNPTTTISYDVPGPTDIKIVVFNISGQIVRTLVNNNVAPGSYKIIWDAKNDAGINVPSGIYYYRMQTGDQTFTKKLLLLK